MGCDIHALIERRSSGRNWHEWLNSGDPDIGRNYEMFAVLADVRNYDGIVPICEPKGLPDFNGWSTFSDGERWAKWKGYDKPCREMIDMAERYGEDGHSATWLTLAEIKTFDTDQEVVDESLIVGRSEAGAVTATARMTTGPHHGAVGRRKVLRWPGEDEPRSWLRLIRYMEQAKWDGQSDEEVRLVCFFDN